VGATQRYDEFFSPLGEGAQAGKKPAIDAGESGPTMLWAAGDSRSSDGPEVGSQGLLESRPDTGSGYQLAAASPRRFGDYWSVPGCANCHGYTPTSLPPIGGHFPFPPNYSPRSGGSDGASSSNPRWSERPQCHQQFETDRKICQKARNSKCWENSNKRLEYCDRTGEVTIPPLKFGPPNR